MDLTEKFRELTNSGLKIENQNQKFKRINYSDQEFLSNKKILTSI